MSLRNIGHGGRAIYTERDLDTIIKTLRARAQADLDAAARTLNTAQQRLDGRAEGLIYAAHELEALIKVMNDPIMQDAARAVEEAAGIDKAEGAAMTANPASYKRLYCPNGHSYSDVVDFGTQTFLCAVCLAKLVPAEPAPNGPDIIREP